MKVPLELETTRLLLRQFRNEDWRSLHEYYSDINATRYTVGRELSEGESWRTMACMLGHWQLHGFGPYAIELKETQELLGTVGFWYPADWPEPEIKWGLIPKYWGKGYASEGARAVHLAGRKHMPEISLISFIDRNNTASINLALAVGAVFEKELDFRGGRFQVYRHKREPN